MIKRKTMVLTIITLFLVIMMVIATFFDYQISLALSTLEKGEYYSKNLFCIIFEMFGELPSYLISSFALCVLMVAVEKKIKSVEMRWVVKSLCILIIIILNTICFYRTFNYVKRYFHVNLNDLTVVLIGIVYSSALCCLLFFLTGKINSDDVRSLSIWSLIAIFTIVFSQATVHVLKPAIGRIRFRTINYLGDESLFSNWYDFSRVDKNVKLWLKNLIGSDSYKSFPSGHTTGCASLLTLILLPKYVRKLNNEKANVIIAISTVLLTVLVALSRIMIGAHFLSDVVVAIILTTVMLALSVELVEKKIKIRLVN